MHLAQHKKKRYPMVKTLGVHIHAVRQGHNTNISNHNSLDQYDQTNVNVGSANINKILNTQTESFCSVSYVCVLIHIQKFCTPITQGHSLFCILNFCNRNVICDSSVSEHSENSDVRNNRQSFKQNVNIIALTKTY